jgi:hypothetical protein
VTRQASIISPWIFDICIEPLILDLARRLGHEYIAVYADDLTILSTESLLDRTPTDIMPLVRKLGLEINIKKTQVIKVLKT